MVLGPILCGNQSVGREGQTQGRIRTEGIEHHKEVYTKDSKDRIAVELALGRVYCHVHADIDFV